MGMTTNCLVIGKGKKKANYMNMSDVILLECVGRALERMRLRKRKSHYCQIQ